MMTPQEKAFIEKPKAYQDEIFKLALAIQNLNDSDKIVKVSLHMSEKHKEFGADLEMMLRTINQIDPEEEASSDKCPCTSCHKPKEDEQPETEEADTIDIEEFMYHTSEALLSLMDRINILESKSKVLEKGLDINSMAIAYIIKNKES